MSRPCQASDDSVRYSEDPNASLYHFDPDRDVHGVFREP